MEYIAIYSDENLSHHGIKGQKWGVRRWQNPDGSYNEAGEKRYRGENSKIAKAYAKAEKLRAKAEKNRIKSAKYAEKRDRLKSRHFKTDISIGRERSADVKSTRARLRADRLERKAAKLEQRAVKWAQDNDHGSTLMSNVSNSDRRVAEEFIRKNS